MGNVNFDLSKSKPYKYLAWGCAAIGAGVGVHMAGAVTVGGMVAAGVAGGVVGACTIPTAVGVTGVALFMVGKSLLKFLKEEAPLIPLMGIMIGYSSLRTLAEPFISGAKWVMRKTRKGSDETTAPRAAIAPEQQDTATPSKLAKLRLPNVFKKKPKLEERERLEPTFNKADNDDLASSPGLTD